MKLVEEVIRTEEHGLSEYIKNEEKGYNKLLKSLTMLLRMCTGIL